MDVEEIQQAVAKLSSDELTRFREWFMEYENKLMGGISNESKHSIGETLRRLKGSLKGKGGLKTLLDERRMDKDKGK